MPTTVSTPGDIAKLQRQIDALAGRVAALEAPVVVPPPVEPPPPPPPEPPPTDLLPVAGLTVPLAGRVRVGVAVAPGTARALGRVRVDDIEAQADNPVFDRDGWLRWFLLSAILPAGTHRIAISPTAQTAAPVPSPSPQVTIAGMGQATRIADWRRGPVVTEAVWRAPVGADGLAVQICESLWADGKSGRTIVYENGRSVPGEVAARTLIYDGVTHVPYTRWLRRGGEQPVFAEVFPLEGGDAWDQFRAARLIPNYTADPGAPNLASLDAVPDVPFPPPVNGWIGPFSAEQGGPGDNPDIGVFPIYHLQALRHLSAGGLRMLTRTADLRQGAPYFIRSAATGGFHRPDEGKDYVLDGRWASEKTPQVGKGDGTPSNQWWELAHWGSMFYLPYLVTGELAYLEGQVAQAFVDWANAPSVAPGNDPAPPAPPHPHGWQLTRHGITNRRPRYWDCGDSTFAGHVQERQMGWGVRTTVQTLACLPSDDERVRALLGWDKTVGAKLWEGVTDTLHACYVVGSAERFPPGSYRRIHSQQGNHASWMQGTIWASLAHGCELGVMPPRALEFVRWWFQGLVDPFLDPAFGAEWIIDGSFFTTRDREMNSWNSPVGVGEPCMTPGEVFRASTGWSEVPTTPRSQVHANDWAGYWGDAFSAAVDLGVPRASEALAAFRALARRWEGRDWLYSVKHSAAPMGAGVQ